MQVNMSGTQTYNNEFRWDTYRLIIVNLAAIHIDLKQHMASNTYNTYND